MKIQIASDLHLELRRGHQPEIHDFYPVDDRDVLVLAGDIGTYMDGWALSSRSLGVRRNLCAGKPRVLQLADARTHR